MKTSTEPKGPELWVCIDAAPGDIRWFHKNGRVFKRRVHQVTLRPLEDPHYYYDANEGIIGNVGENLVEGNPYDTQEEALAAARESITIEN